MLLAMRGAFVFAFAHNPTAPGRDGACACLRPVCSLGNTPIDEALSRGHQHLLDLINTYNAAGALRAARCKLSACSLPLLHALLA